MSLPEVSAPLHAQDFIASLGDGRAGRLTALTVRGLTLWGEALRQNGQTVTAFPLAPIRCNR